MLQHLRLVVPASLKLTVVVDYAVGIFTTGTDARIIAIRRRVVEVMGLVELAHLPSRLDHGTRVRGHLSGLHRGAGYVALELAVIDAAGVLGVQPQAVVESANRVVSRRWFANQGRLSYGVVACLLWRILFIAAAAAQVLGDGLAGGGLGQLGYVAGVGQIVDLIDGRGINLARAGVGDQAGGVFLGDGVRPWVSQNCRAKILNRARN